VLKAMVDALCHDPTAPAEGRVGRRGCRCSVRDAAVEDRRRPPAGELRPSDQAAVSSGLVAGNIRDVTANDGVWRPDRCRPADRDGQR
jgi:hypothetical protein